MQTELVTYETTKLAKEKGFRDGCDYIYDNGELIYMGGYEPAYKQSSLDKYNHSNEYLCPFQSDLQKHIWEKHKLHIVIIPTICGHFTYRIVDIQLDPSHEIERPPYNDVCARDFITYEQALEEGLYESLKIIK